MTLDPKALEAASVAVRHALPAYIDGGEASFDQEDINAIAEDGITAYLEAEDPWCYDMDEAPRDGTAILVNFPHWGNSIFITAHWSEDDWSFQDGKFDSRGIIPTAWMHIPTPKGEDT